MIVTLMAIHNKIKKKIGGKNLTSIQRMKKISIQEASAVYTQAFVPT